VESVASPSETVSETSNAAPDSVSSLAADAFARLTALQDGLRHRVEAVARREAEVARRERELEEHAKELEAQRECVGRREEVVAAFQEMLALMQTAIQEPSPAEIMAALDAGTTYEDRVTVAKQTLGLTPQEEKRFLAARGSGTGDAEILAEIYAARGAAAAA
jgi:hypothetical protein